MLKKNPLVGVVVSIAAVVFATACDTDDITTPNEFAAAEFSVGHDRNTVRVMTYNVYVGADVDVVLATENPEEIPFLVATAFQQLLATNFHERAQAIAKQIAFTRPHLIGLQEISTIRIQSPGDAIIGGTTPAEDVLFDYLDILLDALAAAGLHYSVAGVVENANVEVPMIVGFDPPAFDDVRLTDFDVVLARSDVPVSRVAEVRYIAELPVPSFGISIPRGFVAVDATVDGRTYRFANTHLEPFSELVQVPQAQQLIATMDDEEIPVIVVGDLNSRAPTGTTYQLFQSAGYVDAWTENVNIREGEGLTNPHDADLRNEEVNFDKRIDLIFVRNLAGSSEVSVVGPAFGYVLGDDFNERTRTGMWPSDHAGVVLEIHIPETGSTLAD